MSNKDKVIVERERHFSAHHMFLAAAHVAVSDIKNENPHSPLIGIMMSALAIESLCNTIGERIVFNWKDFESSSPIAKLRIICDELKIEYDANTEPWSTVVWLSKIRNSLAHPKPDKLKENYEWSQEEYSKNYDLWPKSKLEKFMTNGNAQRAYQRVIELKFILCKKIPTEKAFGLAVDAWFGRSSA